MARLYSEEDCYYLNTMSADNFKPDIDKVQRAFQTMQAKVELFYSSNKNAGGTIYTGLGGIAYMYWHLSETLKGPTYLEKARYYIEQAKLAQFKPSSTSFAASLHGVHALEAVIGSCWSEGLLDVSVDAQTSLEFLDGLAGHLYSLRFLLAKFSEHAEEINAKIEHYSALIKEEMKMADSVPVWAWHGKHYLGAAHGGIGIIYQLQDDKLKRQFMERYAMCGNFPSSTKSSGRLPLVHWCHGAPGALASGFCADKCVETTWEKGLLKKGVGLCHGIAGNGYALLVNGYVRHAACFADFMIDQLAELEHRPDHPFSLFEGMAGAVCFMADLLMVLQGEKKASDVRFPAYGIP